MLSASLSVTGTHRVLLDLISGLDRSKFQIFIAYKPEFPGPGNDLVPEIQKMGFQIFSLPGQHLFHPKGLLNLFRILSNHEIDIIHCWDSFSLFARIIGKITGAKIIDSIGNPPADESWKNRLANKVSSPFLDGLIFVSNGSRQAHHEYGSLYLCRCIEAVIYNSINVQDIQEYDPIHKKHTRMNFGFSQEDIILCNSGMLNIQKSQENLISAMPHIIKNFKNVKLVIVGWGTREKILRDQIQALNLSDYIFLAGKKQRHEVFDLLAITDIYVSSSLWEGLPVAVLEAMAFQLPIVATDVIGNREAIVDNETGLLVPVCNPSALGNAILTLINDKELRKQMGNRGLKRVTEYFTPDRFIREHELFYMSILSRSNEHHTA